MTLPKQKQLDYLVEHYNSWEFGAESCTVKQGPAWSGNEVKPSPFYAVFLTDDSGDITYEEWATAREKTQTKLTQDNSWFENNEYPPVGTECEFRYKYSDRGQFDDWQRGIIKYIGNDIFVVEQQGGNQERGKEYVRDLNCTQFRPIVVSDREKAIKEMMNSIGRKINTCGERLLLEALYDAGYHK